MLKNFSGILQTDGYGAYKTLVEADRAHGAIALAHCWAHARRRFFELAKGGAAPIADEALRRIAGLYAIEAEIRGQDAGTRKAARQARSRPLVLDLKLWLEARLTTVAGRSPMAEAIRYTLARWEGLTRFLGDGRIELELEPGRAVHSADRAELQERPVRRLRRGRRELGRPRHADRVLQAARRQPAQLSHRRAHPPRQRPPREPNRRTHAVGVERRQHSTLAVKHPAKGNGAPLTANQFRLLIHTVAYWLRHTLRGLAPARSFWRDAQFDTLRLARIKVAARVTEMATRIKVALPPCYPYQDSLILLSARAAKLPP